MRSYHSVITTNDLEIDHNAAPSAPGRAYYGTLDIGNEWPGDSLGGSGADPFTMTDRGHGFAAGYNDGDWLAAGIYQHPRGGGDPFSHAALNIGVVDFTPGSGTFGSAATLDRLRGAIDQANRFRAGPIDVYGRRSNSLAT